MKAAKTLTVPVTDAKDKPLGALTLLPEHMDRLQRAALRKQDPFLCLEPVIGFDKAGAWTVHLVRLRPPRFKPIKPRPRKEPPK